MLLSEISKAKLLLWLDAEISSPNEHQILLAYDFIEQYMTDHGFLLDAPRLRHLILAHIHASSIIQADIEFTIDNKIQLLIDILEMNKLARISSFHMLNNPIE
jgi:hypothetical protein